MKLNDFKDAAAYIAHMHDERRNDPHYMHVSDAFEGVCHVCRGSVEMRMHSHKSAYDDITRHWYAMQCNCGNYVEISCDAEGCVIE